MAHELQATPLRRCLEKIIDYRGKTPKKLGSDWIDEGYRALSAINVKDSGLVSTETIRCVDAETYKKWMKEEVKRGDILLTSEAPAGEVMIWNSDEKIVLSQRLFCLRADKKFDNRFLKYYLQSPTGKREVNRTRSGSTVAGISAEMFDQIQVLHPETHAQKKISAVLSALDAKIDLNNSINAELEALAETIYDYWFVQFDFPDAKGRPYKSSGGKLIWDEVLKREIPVGWEAVSLRSLVDCNARSYGTNNLPDKIGYLDTSNLTNNRLFSVEQYDTRNDEVPSRARRIVSNDDVLYSTVRPNQKHHGIIKKAEKNLVASTGFAVLTCTDKRINGDFIYMFIRANDVAMKMQRIAESSRSSYPSIAPDDLLDLKLALPASGTQIGDAIHFFDRAFKTIWTNDQQNIELTQLRDWLLPLLMNGQVRVV